MKLGLEITSVNSGLTYYIDDPSILWQTTLRHFDKLSAGTLRARLNPLAEPVEAKVDL